MSINPERQIRYWRQGAEEDLNTARLLLDHGKSKEALFFAHLALEKALKALVAQKTSDVPPYSHDLSFLANKAGLTLSESEVQFLAMINKWATAGRYPDLEKPAVSKPKTEEILAKTSEVMEWLIQKLSP